MYKTHSCYFWHSALEAFRKGDAAIFFSLSNSLIDRTLLEQSSLEADCLMKTNVADE